MKKAWYKRWWIWVVLIALIATAVGGYYWYSKIKVPHDNATAAFNEAVKPIEDKNAEADGVINTAQELLDSDAIPLDESTISDLQIAISSLREAQRTIIDIPAKTADIENETKRLKEPLDYSEQIITVQSTQQALEDSIKQLTQITNPTGDFVVERISEIEAISGVQGVTEDNDPNGNLNKQGGYTSATYFTSSLVDQSEIYGDDIVEKGTDAGGCVEVYQTVDEANTRNAYLSSFDGAGIFNSGSHVVFGTTVIRTSDSLTATQQDEMTEQIKKLLIELR